jgi:TolB-like protein
VLQDPPPFPLVGRTLGHYEILSVLGKGGMGVVYLAEDQHLHRKVALKVLPPEMSTDPERLKRFRREAKTVASISHPNVVTLHSVEEADGFHFLTMELVEGRTLNDEIPPGGLPLRRALDIAAALAGALASAHERGVLHRDMKPANVMVGPHGWVKVLDFGLAKLRPQDEATWIGGGTSLVHTQEGKVLGTPSYMSPEQLRGQPAEERSDIFSFGLVLYEMLTGVLPFAGENSAERIAAVLRDPPQPLAAVRPDLPSGLCRLVERCLAKEVGRRPASAAEVRDEIARLQRELEISALMASGSMPAPAEAPRRSRRWEAVGAAAVLIAIVALGVYRVRTPASSSASPPADAADAEARRPAVAVLPLGNFSGEPDYFVDGMTDGLIGALARLGGMRVISRQSAMHYKGSTKLLSVIAAELDVDYIIEGSVQRDGDRLRLQTQVVQPDPEEHLLARTFERPVREVLTLHDETARAIARALHAPIVAAEETQMASAKSVEPNVYEAYLQGRFWAGKFSTEDLLRARGYFERAVALDPTFAPAWTGLAETLSWLGRFHLDTERTMSEAEAAARRALQIDPSEAAAHAVLSGVAQGRWRWQDAEEHARRAIALDPSSAPAHRSYWRLLAPQRRFVESRREIDLAVRLDPLSAQIASNLGVQLLLEERYDEAEPVLRHALELDPDFTLTHAWLWHLYSKLEKDPERGEELGFYLEALGLGAARPQLEREIREVGYERALRAVALRLSAQYRSDAAQVGVITGLLAEADELEEALRWLRFGLEKRAWEMPWLSVTPDLNNLRGHPEYERILGQLGIPAPPA